MSVENDGGMTLTGENRRTRRKTCPSATLYTTNPIWIDPGGSPGLRSERPTTNCLSHGTALPKIFTASIIKTFALMTEAVRISETPVSFYGTAQHNIPDESRLHYLTAGFCMAPYQIFSPMHAICHLNIIFDLMTRLIA
jgi:hypothetical protein